MNAETRRDHWVVGLTGGIGSGKTRVSDHFRTYGATVIDADEISRSLTSAQGAAMPAIVSAFGDRMVDAHGALDRAAMREAVFADPSFRARLEAILHPMIRAEMFAQLRHASPNAYVLWVVPLLVEHRDQHTHCDRILVVDCDEPTQLARVQARSGLSADAIVKIVRTQAKRAERLRVADDTIDNSGDFASRTAPQIDRLHRFYLRLFTAHKERAAAQGVA